MEMIATNIDDPHSFEKTCKSKKWRESMDAEMKVIERNNTWELVDSPKGITPIEVKWIFKTKFNEVAM